MPNFFYFDEANGKRGPLTPAQVKALAAKGVITPDTLMETDTGKSGFAKQLPGLFTATRLAQSDMQSEPGAVAPDSVSTDTGSVCSLLTFSANPVIH